MRRPAVAATRTKPTSKRSPELSCALACLRWLNYLVSCMLICWLVLSYYLSQPAGQGPEGAVKLTIQKSLQSLLTSLQLALDSNRDQVSMIPEPPRSITGKGAINVNININAATSLGRPQVKPTKPQPQSQSQSQSQSQPQRSALIHMPSLPPVLSPAPTSHGVHRDEKVVDIESTSRQQSNAVSRFAYVTLIHGIDDTFKYRGFIYNVLIMKTALSDSGSREDFYCFIGFSSEFMASPSQRHLFQSDLDLLTNSGIRLHILPRLTTGNDKKKRLSFAEMALLKVTPWSFVQYERLQFFDGDVMPLANMDCLFQLPSNTFNTGLASPLNSGWFLTRPNLNDYQQLVALAKVRLNTKWDEINGWGKPIPGKLYFRGSNKLVTKYDFNGASLDQGLLLYYYVMTHGNVTLLDTEMARIYAPEYQYHEASVASVLQCCSGKKPISFFAHFTGHNKPWLASKKGYHGDDRALKQWMQHLDRLKLSINSSNIHTLNLGSSLGYFYPNKRS